MMTSPPNLEPLCRLRRGVPSDLSALVHLEASSFGGDRVSARSFRRWFDDRGALLLVLESKARPQVLNGYALTLLHWRGRVARLYSLAVEPRLRGQGLGMRLLQASMDEARRRDFEELRLEVSEANRAALALYEKADFQRFARRPGYYADGSDALRLRRSL